MKKILLLIICLSLLSCAGYNGANHQTSAAGQVASTTKHVTRKVETRGFSEANGVVDLGEMDPVEKVFLADLDRDGFEELYLVTRCAGSGSYAAFGGRLPGKQFSRLR